MSKKQKIAATIAKVALHVVGFPVLFLVVLLINLEVIKGGISYGLPVFVSLIVTAVMAIIFYATYFLVRTKKSRSIRNQHVIIAIVALCSLMGLWMVVDAFLPEPLETATSSTLRWEDLSDNWAARAEVNEDLLEDYITLNYTLGRLEGETLDTYLKEGNSNDQVAELLKQDFSAIDQNGYATFVGPSIDYAQMDRMTIPVLLHLLLDDRDDQKASTADGLSLEIKMPVYRDWNGDEVHIVRAYDPDAGNGYLFVDEDFNKTSSTSELYIVKPNTESTKTPATDWLAEKRVNMGPVDGKVNEEIETMACATAEEALSYLTATYPDAVDNYYICTYEPRLIRWTVLDMMGDPMAMGLLGPDMMELDIDAAIAGATGGMINLGMGTVGDMLDSELVQDTLIIAGEMIGSDDLLGAPIYISFDKSTGSLVLTPSNSARGVLGYMQMGWLNSNGLLYVIVSLFSCRTVFYIYAPIMALIAIALGWIREKEAALSGGEPTPKRSLRKKKGEQAEEVAETPAEEEVLLED
ncbi:MAG: hypothetical protein IJX70_00240 [Clostridia bacterium]|nr:hypothetical protein [Clostridia bacterium]